LPGRLAQHNWASLARRTARGEATLHVRPAAAAWGVDRRKFPNP